MVGQPPLGSNVSPEQATGRDLRLRRLPHEAVIDVLSALVERSFVNRLGTTTEARYRLHETMRYALDRLREAGEEEPAWQDYVDFYAKAVRHSFGDWMTAKILDGLGWTEHELDNIRAALQHCLVTPHDRERGRSMVGQLAWYLSS